MKKIALATLAALVVAGCASQPNPYNPRATTLNDQCNPIERDLTTLWENRYYWCADSYYKKQATDLQKQIARENAIRERELALEAKRLERVRAQELKQLNRFEKEVEQTPTTIAFPPPSKTVTETSSISESSVSFSAPRGTTTETIIDGFISNNRQASLIKVSGCQLISEEKSAGFNRAQEAKNSLIKKGFKGNIVVEGGQCFSGQSIEIEEI